MAAAARAGLKCLEVCGYCCQVVACGVETVRSVWFAFTKICTCGQGWKGMVKNSITIITSEEDPDFKDFELPVVASRRFTDVPAFFVFIAALTGMCYAMNRALTFGKPEVFSNGVDSWMNSCGVEQNQKYPGVPYSGLNMSAYSKLFIIDFLTQPDKITGTSQKEDYLQICIRICPPGKKTFRCGSYLKEFSTYGPALQTRLCANSAVGDIPLFSEKNHRCVPTELFEDVSIQRQNSLLNLYSNNWLHNLVHDCSVCAAELTWLILIALGFTMIFMVIVHAAANALCWYSFATFFIVGSAATGYMWYLHSIISDVDSGISIYAARPRYSDPQTFAESVLKMAFRLFPMGRNTNSSVPQAGYSIVFRDAAIYSTATVVAGCIICILVGRRNMDACAVVFEQGTRCMMALKWLYLLPLTSIMCLCFGFGLMMHTFTYLTAIFLEDPRIVGTNATGIVKAFHVPNTVYTTWVLIFEFLGIIWVYNFVLACQHMIVALTVGTWYFSINKEEMYRPIRVAISRLIRKHLGSAIAGAFLVGYFGILRAPLSFLQSRIVTATERAKRLQRIQLADGESYYAIPPSTGPKKAENERNRKAQKEEDYESLDSGDGVEQSKAQRKAHVAVETWKMVNKGCSPFFWLLNHVFIYISDLNYSVVALKGLWFLESGRDIRRRMEEIEKLKGINAISSFALFLGKLTITIAVLPIGFLLLKDKQGVFMYGYPLAVSALLSFLVSHIFFSLLEASTGAMFICYVEDVSLNQGNQSKPYFGSKVFFQKFHNALEEVSPEEAARLNYTKIHWDEENISEKQQKMMEDEEEPSDSFDDDSVDGINDNPLPKPKKPILKTVDETKKKKKDKDLNSKDPSSLFLLMPDKKKKPQSTTYKNDDHIYDDPYEEEEEEPIYDEIRDWLDDAEDAADEMEERKRKQKHKQGKERHQKKETEKKKDSQKKSEKEKRGTNKDKERKHSKKEKHNKEGDKKAQQKRKQNKTNDDSKKRESKAKKPRSTEQKGDKKKGTVSKRKPTTKGQSKAPKTPVKGKKPKVPSNKLEKLKKPKMGKSKGEVTKNLGKSKSKMKPSPKMKMKGPKTNMAKKFKGMKNLKGAKKGFNPGKIKGLKMPKVKAPGGKMGGKMGPGDAIGGATGAMNIADGMLRIAGKKGDAEKMAHDAAFGTRNRSKTTALLSHIAENRQKRIDEIRKPSKFKIPLIAQFQSNRDLILGGKKILEDVDKEWDEIEENDDSSD